MKKAGARPAFLRGVKYYFLSAGAGSAAFGASAGAVGDAPVAPVPGGLASGLASAGAGVGAGGGAAVLGAGAAGGGVTTFSSFLLQAVRAIATQAARRSERFIVIL
jgi:hypothetical protein